MKKEQNKNLDGAGDVSPFWSINNFSKFNDWGEKTTEKK